jgi:hypothetical protein
MPISLEELEAVVGGIISATKQFFEQEIRSRDDRIVRLETDLQALRDELEAGLTDLERGDAA